MGAAATARCDGRDTRKTKQYQNQLWMGGERGVVLMLGHISSYRHASTPRYRPTIPSGAVQEGI